MKVLCNGVRCHCLQCDQSNDCPSCRVGYGLENVTSHIVYIFKCEANRLQIYAQLFGFAKYFENIFFKKKMWGSLNPIAIGSQGVAVQLLPNRLLWAVLILILIQILTCPSKPILLAHLSSESINFFCFNVFFIAFSLTIGSSLCINSKYSVGTTCQDNPYLSLHHPQDPSSPPLAVRASQ